jgi:hypothetical protein
MAKETKKEREAREKKEAAEKEATIKAEGSIKQSPSTPTKGDLSAMIGHLKYNSHKSEEVRLALQHYQQAPNNVKHEMWQLFKSDKSCKWSKNFCVTTESKSSTSTGTLSGVCTWCL